MSSLEPFEELKKVETLLDQTRTSQDPEADFSKLTALLVQERILDRLRIKMFEENRHGSQPANDYLYREYLVRHRISVFAQSLDRTVTDRVTCESPEQKSAVAICIKNREAYPRPILKTK